MKFSERNNLEKTKDVQRNSLDERTRIRLYNILSDELTTSATKYRDLTSYERLKHEFMPDDVPEKIGYTVPFTLALVTKYEKLYTEILDYLGRISKPVKITEFLDYVKTEIMDNEWFKIFDLFEFIIEKSRSTTLPDKMNEILKKGNSIYRFSTELMGFTNIENEADKQNIDEVLKITKGRFEGSHAAMKKALHFFSDRNNPDFHNAIKESISAVESLVKAITGSTEKNLEKQLGKISDNYSLQSDIKTIILRLWGYRSNVNGIGHAINGDLPENISRAETLFIISSCSAIISYLVSMSENN